MFVIPNFPECPDFGTNGNFSVQLLQTFSVFYCSSSLDFLIIVEAGLAVGIVPLTFSKLADSSAGKTRRNNSCFL